ncbi:MAG: type 4a pilus biogenesis protein PilO [Nitrospirae bacterium]|nr:type 4a pilus biogenesis protein PilO [Candidatus Manganitrophaceae bacterium]
MSVLSQLQWSKLSRRERILFVTTVMVALCMLIIFVLQPRVVERRKLDSQKKTLQQEISALSSALPILLQRAEAEKANPPSKPRPELVEASLSSILDEIGRKARMREVQVIELKPSLPETKEGIEVLPIQMKTRSRFFSLGDYIAALEGLPRPIAITRLKIESRTETSPEVAAEMTLYIYKKRGI